MNSIITRALKKKIFTEKKSTIKKKIIGLKNTNNLKKVTLLIFAIKKNK